MCLSLPGKIIKIKGNIAVVDFSSHKHEAKCDLKKDLKINDYVYIHAGYILDKVNKKEAEKILNLIKQ